MIAVHLSSLADDLDALETTPVPRADSLEESVPRPPIEIRAPGAAIPPLEAKPPRPHRPTYPIHTTLEWSELSRRYRIAQVQRSQMRRERDVWHGRWQLEHAELLRTQAHNDALGAEVRRLEALASKPASADLYRPSRGARF